MKIGFIGLGIMGSRMAANLQKAGYDLIIYNRSTDKTRNLTQAGAVLASGIEEVGEEADVLFTMLSTPKVVRKHAELFLPKMKAGSWWVDCSTVNPSFSREMAELVKQYNVQFVDAPVAGSKAPAENGELLFLAGGEEKDLQLLAPCFQAMGKKTLYLNKSGHGANVKMLINLMLAQSMATFSEAMSLGRAMGLEESLLLNTLTSTPVVSPVMGLLKDRLLTGDFEVNFPLKWIHKDVHLAIETANELNVPMPSLVQTKTLYENALEKGFGEEDFSAIYKSIT